MLIPAVGIVLFVIMYKRRMLRHQAALQAIRAERDLMLAKASIQAEEEERLRISAELHDDIGMNLTSVRLFLAQAVNDYPVAAASIGQSIALLDEGISHVRNLSHQLHPATLQHLGLETALKSLLETLRKTGVLETAWSAAAALPKLDEPVALAVFRICQELINNILKHAHPTVLRIETGSAYSRALLSIFHNGAGIGQEAYEALLYKPGTVGLKNIANRLKSINGGIQFTKTDKLYAIELSLIRE